MKLPSRANASLAPLSPTRVSARAPRSGPDAYGSMSLFSVSSAVIVSL
jgi:hypothetical protein